jgi:type I restriction enzyme S subunit
MSELPHGWIASTIGEITTPFETLDPNSQPDAEFRYIDIGSIDNKIQVITDPKTFLGRDAPSRARRVVKEGDILFSTVRTYLKNIAIVPSEMNGDLTSTGISIIRPSEVVDGRFLFYWVISDIFISAMSKAQDGTLYPAVTDRDVSAGPIPLPPIQEQRRIAAKIDGLTARTARARADLDRIPKLVARYKSRLLALAFSGELTAGWRQANGAPGGIDRSLPRGWAQARLGDISEIQGGIQVGKKRTSSASLVEVPYLRVANVQRGWLNLSEIKSIEVTAQERDRLLLQSGDILMNEGGDRDKLGRGWIWNGQLPVCIHQNHVFRIRLSDKEFPPEYVSHYANENGQRYFFDEGTQTTNLASINKSKVAALPVPLPPTEEAIEIVRLIDSAFGWLDRMAADHQAAAKLLPKLDGAILAKAFRGELVPQDPADEPADVLLERIRVERPEDVKQTRTRRPRKSKETADMARRLVEVLSEATDWLPAQEAFRRCGVADGAQTDEIEGLYAELRALDKEGRISVEPVLDPRGRKLHDRLKLRVA